MLNSVFSVNCLPLSQAPLVQILKSKYRLILITTNFHPRRREIRQKHKSLYILFNYLLKYII